MPQLKISKREAVMLSALAFFTAVYLYVNFILVPQYNRINALQSEIGRKRNVAAELKSKKEQLNNLNKDMESIKSEIAATEKQIPYTKRIPEMLVNLDAKITEYKLKFLSAAFDESAQKDTSMEASVAEAVNSALGQKQKDQKENNDYMEVPVGLSFEGKYDDIIDFLKYLENADRKYIIDGFKLDPINRNTPMSVSLSFKTFVLKDAGNTHQEPIDYPFMKGNLGKDYPFFDNPIIPPQALNLPQLNLPQADSGSEPIQDFTGNSGDGGSPDTENTDTGN